jgi:hypothetical protein
MKKYRLLTGIILTVGFDYLFWEQNLGLNILISFLAILPIVLLLNEGAWKKTTVRITISGTFLSALMILLYSSTSAKFAFVSSFTIMMGFVHQNDLRTVYHAFLNFLSSLFQSPQSISEELSHLENKRTKKIFSTFQLALIPIAVLNIFYWIFKFANPVFDQLSTAVWVEIWKFLESFFINISILRTLFILSGFILINGILFNRKLKLWLEKEILLTDPLIRNRKSTKGYAFKFGELYKELKNEYRSGVIMVLLVNLLLLIVNGIDIHWIWFNFDYEKAGNLAQFVHEGTYLLILSILIAIGIILYFFKGNINHLKNNRNLKSLTYLWIFQNMILAFSVALRNYHYIHQHGIAYKRIGVILFLILVIIGLVSLALKIRDKKSAFYLFRVNSWSLYFVMIAMSLFDWDMIIVHNNVNHPNEAGIDKAFLLTLSDKTLSVLQKNKNYFQDTNTYIAFNGMENATVIIDKRVAEFLETYPGQGWQSFNVAETNCYKNLKK